MTELTGRTAVVTGAGSGLGAAMARAFADAGADVAAARHRRGRRRDQRVHDRGRGRRHDHVGALRRGRHRVGGRPPPNTCASTLGGCDILCSNVGVQQFGAIDKLTEQDWQWVLNVNVLGTVRTVREFLPMLRARQRLPPHRVHRVVERPGAVGAPRRLPDQQVRGPGVRASRCARSSRTRTSASPCCSRAG